MKTYVAAVFVFGVLAVASADVSHAEANPRLEAWLDSNLPDLVDTYRELHAHPELSLEEEKTAARVAREFSGAGYKVTVGVGGHGVVGVLKNGPGPVVLIRGDT
ncbi:MAG: amidohydrolase, partial [Myxococcota bacterium]